MPTKKKSIDVKNLKGTRLYNFLVKELGLQNAAKPKKQRLGIESRRKIVSEQLYPKFKADPKRGIRAIRAEIRKIIDGLPPKEICNPLYLPDAYLQFIEYYEIDNHIRNQLPECLDVMVNAGGFGKTKIFNTSNYSYYGTGVRKIIENIRKEVENESGEAYFDGLVKLKNKKPNNGAAENYYVEYILFLNNKTEGVEEEVEFELNKTEKKKTEDIRTYFQKKFKTLQKEKAKRKRQAKKAKENTDVEKKKRATASIRAAVKSYRELLKQGLITQAQFNKMKKTIEQVSQKKLKKKRPLKRK
jgi:hypothetical protein